MIRTRLQGFTSEELISIAERIGLDINLMTDKDFLIEEIVSACEDNKIEREATTNFIMQIKQKKFQLILDDEELVLDQDDVLDVYGKELQRETKIRLMLRDPRWGFAYWFYSRPDFKALSEKNATVVLRVYQMVEGDFSSLELENTKKPDYFDIPISLDDSKWYISLPEARKRFFVELIKIVDDEETSLCRSNFITSFSLHYDKCFKDNIDERIIASGLYELEGPSKDRMGDSHRILTEEESQYIREGIE